MKRSLFMLAFALFGAIYANATDISYYQEKFDEQVQKFQDGGLESNAEFFRMMQVLDTLQQDLKNDASVAKKEPLLSNVIAMQYFVAELSPTKINYEFKIEQKERIFSLLGIKDSVYNDSSLCIPIKVIKLWDKQSCFFVENAADSFLVNFKLNFIIQRKFSETTGTVDAGVSKKCVRFIYNTSSQVDLVINEESCEKVLQMDKIIKPEVIPPPVDEYPDPDYLSPAQKKALKNKEKEKLKKEKAKAKKLAKKEKEKKKKLAKKDKAKKKREMMKEKAEMMKAKKEAAKAKK